MPALRFHGRRKGRRLSGHQSWLLANKLSGLEVDPGRPLREPAAVRALFGMPVREVWLEIGFGSGEHLIWQALQNPHVAFIGAEPFLNGVAAALARIANEKLEARVRLFADEADPLLDWLPSASVARAFTLFPDPWPKKRHRSRRLFCAPVLDKLVRVIEAGGELRFASDVEDYARGALDLGQAHPLIEVTHHFTSDNRDAVPDWPITRYESKAVAAGRISTFLVMRRVSEPAAS